MPAKTSSPPRSTTTRSAKRSSSSRFCVTNTTAPAVAGRARELPEAAALPRIERGRRLVEQEHVRVAEQRDREVESLLVPDRQMRRRTIVVGELHRLEHPRRRRDRIMHTLEASEELEVLAR